MRDDKMLDIWRLAPAFSAGADADDANADDANADDANADDANAIEAMGSVFSGGGAR